MKPIVFNDELLKELHHGIETTFQNMFGIPTTPGPHVIGEASILRGDISGIINLVQDANRENIEGSLILSFPNATIIAMLMKIYNRPFTSADKNVGSGVGELTNIVFGVFKANINNKGFSFQMALPNVIFGEHHQMSAGTPGYALTIPFESPVGSFDVALTLDAKQALKSAV